MPIPSGRLPAALFPDALACLREAAILRPDEARKRLAAIHDRYPDVPMRLLWRREAADESYHYDLLIKTADGTISLALAPDRALPWPLRGSQPSGEQVVVRINGTDLEMEQAISVLDVLWDDVRLAERLVNARLVEEEISMGPLELDDAELQQAMDAFRRARGLLTVQAAQEWMAQRGLTLAGLEHLVARQAAVRHLRRRIVAGRVEDVFGTRRDEFDRLHVLRLQYADSGPAEAAALRLRSGADPVTLATQEVLADAAVSRTEGVRRRDLPATATRAGDVLGPFPVESGFAVVYVLQVRPAVLDDATRALIEEWLFGEWLADQRREATIEWLWGTATRTESVNAALGNTPHR
ncbi:TIGR04500 family putative peptide maturation system protein [Streptosporangium sp. NPDC002544]|uniref:TIGR04500 family putative peptide maturation system protein n=1 Tax=Streptosporangium sp. NPDC002544 TaxID=3154538 RepID=UPI0033245C1A